MGNSLILEILLCILVLDFKNHVLSKNPDEWLAFITNDGINKVNRSQLDNYKLTLTSSQKKTVYRQTHLIGLSYHYKYKKYIFAKLNQNSILSVDFDGKNNKTLINSGLSKVEAVAVDWMADNLYFSDNAKKTITVARLDGSSRKIIITTVLDKPRAVAVHPAKGYLFWTDWGKKPMLERAYLDGSNRQALITKSIYWPNGLSIDYEKNLIYWTEANFDFIKVCNLDGTNVRMVLQNAQHPYGITQDRNRIYWTDWYAKSVDLTSKMDKKRKVLFRGLYKVKEIKYIAPWRQIGSNRCSVNNGGCSHLCFNLPSKVVCGCPDLNDTKRACSLAPKKSDISEKAKSKSDAGKGVGMGLSAGYIALITIAIIVAIIVAAFGVFMIRKRNDGNIAMVRFIDG